MTAMASTTILFGALLTLLGLSGYFLTGASSPTALIPAIFGFLLLALGLLARSEPMRKHAMHAAATVALVGCSGALFSLMRASAGPVTRWRPFPRGPWRSSRRCSWDCASSRSSTPGARAPDNPEGRPS